MPASRHGQRSCQIERPIAPDGRSLDYVRYGVGTVDVQKFWPTIARSEKFCQCGRNSTPFWRCPDDRLIQAGEVAVAEYIEYRGPFRYYHLACAREVLADYIVLGLDPQSRYGRIPA